MDTHTANVKSYIWGLALTVRGLVLLHYGVLIPLLFSNYSTDCLEILYVYVFLDGEYDDVLFKTVIGIVLSLLLYF